jgi:uncharacterized protein YyaL (SSP411 family)
VNRLADEASPYLQQHKDNPVDWYPWGEEAFSKARQEDKPILLSVGYSACHWCHVMAHESFEDAGTADVMNRLFVNVKVDREERPDVDAIYMQAVQSMTGHGGWPMTVFMSPDGRPFFGGTYFPREDRHGLPGFVKLLEAVHDAWTSRRGELDEQAQRLTAHLNRAGALRPSNEPLSSEILRNAYTSARAQFEPQFGGFGRAPKFPQAMTLDFLLRTYVRNQAAETLHIVTHSLDAMAAGGMYDQLGGGFHRYSVDDHWLVPHFEKMLYDQALLARTYLHAFLVTGLPRYRRIVEETIDYVLRDLRHADGGFFSAEDADSEGVEGKFYVWSLDEIRDVAGDDADAAIEFWGVTKEGNFEGANILFAVDWQADRPAAAERARAAMYAAREKRVRPGLDDKVLLGWNGLFLATLAEAAAALARDDWMDSARTNARFLLSALRRDDGRFLRAWQNGKQGRPLAVAEDYAAFLEALITLAEVDGAGWLGDASAVADELLRLFADDEAGGFFTTGHDAEQLITRAKEFFDNATPSENSLAAHALLRLAALTGEARYERAGVGVLRLIGQALGDHPTAFAYMLGALERYVTPPLEIAVIGERDDDRTRALRREVVGRFLPDTVTLTAPSADNGSPLLADRPLVDGKATAYVCERYACKQPVTDAIALRAQIDEVLASRR